MKELETHLKIGVDSGNRVEMNVKRQQEIETVLQGTITPQKGHFVWEINEETGEVKKAEYKCDTISFLPLYDFNVPNEKLSIHPDCIYISALNAENAKKKYLKNKKQDYYFDKIAPMNLSDLNL
jgi:hypothetical protein